MPEPLFCSTSITSPGFTSACIASQQASVEYPARGIALQISPEVITIVVAPCSSASLNRDVNSWAK